MYAQGCDAMWNNSLLAAHALPCSVYRGCSCRLWRSASLSGMLRFRFSTILHFNRLFKVLI